MRAITGKPYAVVSDVSEIPDYFKNHDASIAGAQAAYCAERSSSCARAIKLSAADAASSKS
jgi:hypothetical protein